MKHFRNKWVISIVIFLVGYFLLKTIALKVATHVVQKKIREVSNVEVRLGGLNYSLLNRSIAVQGIQFFMNKNIEINIKKVSIGIDIRSLFSLEKKLRYVHVDNFQCIYEEKLKNKNIEYRIDKGHLNIENITYPQGGISPVVGSFHIPEKGEASFKGNLELKKNQDFKLWGPFIIKSMALSSLKEFTQAHYPITLKQGWVFSKSNILIEKIKKKIELRSDHTIAVKSLEIEGDKSVVGTALGLTSGLLTAFLSTSQENTIDLQFRIDIEDILDPNVNGIALLGETIGKAFYARLANFERSPASKIKESAEKVLKGLEDLIP